MNVRNPTGSSLERSEACPASFQLELQVQSTSAASLKGTDNHKEIENAIRSGNLDALKPKTAEFVRSLGCESPILEQGYAINVEDGSVRLIDGRGTNGYEGVDPVKEIALTIDMVAGDYVVDWKSAGRVSAAYRNLQLMAGAYATKAKHVAIHYLDNGETDSSDISPMDHDAFIVRAKDIVRKIRSEKPAIHEGPWCTYCPAKYACPAKTAYVKQALAIAPSEILSAERAGEIWLEVKRARGIIESMEEAIKQMSADVDIPLPNGRVLRQVPVTKKNVDAKAVEAFYAKHSEEVPKYSFTYYQTKEVKP